MISGQIGHLRPYCGVHIAARLQGATRRPAQVVHEDVVKLHPPVSIPRNPIEHFDNRTDLDVQAGLFAHLACDARLEGLTRFYRPARDTPLPRQRLGSTTHEYDARAIDNDRADAHERTVGILPVHSSAFTVLGSCSGSPFGSGFTFGVHVRRSVAPNPEPRTANREPNLNTNREVRTEKREHAIHPSP